MVEIEKFDPSLLVEAVRVWTGWGFQMMPFRDDARLEKRFGGEVAAKLLPVIKALEADFYSSDARLIASDIQEMGKIASEHFKRKYPAMPDEVVKAFSWCYTYDFK